MNRSPADLDKNSPGVVIANDNEVYTYDNDGNRLTLKKRDGSVLSFTYDNLNRMTVKTVPGSTPTTRDVYMRYDLQGHQLDAQFGASASQGLIPGTQYLIVVGKKIGRRRSPRCVI